jgi:ribokinase
MLAPASRRGSGPKSVRSSSASRHVRSRQLPELRTAVVGHLEWTEFLPVERVPRQGEILETRDSFGEPAGGGAVAAVQLARLSGNCTFFTAVGDDENGRRVEQRLGELGVHVRDVRRTDAPTRRAFVYLDSDGERTITTVGERIHPVLGDDLPWDELAQFDAVYLVAGDPGAVRAARAARVLVTTTRIVDLLQRSGVELDAVVGSGSDAGERYRSIEPAPKLVVTTAGGHGGAWTAAEGRTGKWAAAPLPGPRRDAYGAGDSFAAGLTFALGQGLDTDAALALAARCGAMCLTGRGPYERQLSRADL